MVIRSPIPSSGVVVASSNETGWASSRASAVKACADQEIAPRPPYARPWAADATGGGSGW
jgi:hypothetical protein